MLGRIYLERYETIRLLGEGGMGKAYLARDLKQNEPVVVKVMHEHIATNPVFRERFADEMGLMGRLEHENAVILLDASLDEPLGPCIVMEFLPGVSLDKLLQKNMRFNPARLHRFVRQLCGVLQEAHDLGIVHRDLKPANLMVLDPDSPSERIKVMDFGIAKLADPAERAVGAETIKQVEYAVGTPGYMSPEQVRGDPVDHRSDIYSVGAILFELLTGRLPFAGETVMEILMAQATDSPPSFQSLGVGETFPPAVEKVVRKILAIKPADRPQSMKELFESYEEALLGPRGAKESAENEEGGQSAPAPPEPPQPTETSDEEAEEANATVEHLEARISEPLVVPKIQAFVDEIGGTIVESVPGLIRVELRVHRAALRTGNKKGFLSWLGLKPTYGMIEMELHIKKKTEAGNRSVLQITVLLRPADGKPVPVNNPEWTARCAIITKALKGYLMTQG
jgi:eukaryotic-like serine/threonine-protein kinase